MHFQPLSIAGTPFAQSALKNGKPKNAIVQFAGRILEIRSIRKFWMIILINLLIVLYQMILRKQGKNFWMKEGAKERKEETIEIEVLVDAQRVIGPN